MHVDLSLDEVVTSFGHPAPDTAPLQTQSQHGNKTMNSNKEEKSNYLMDHNHHMIEKKPKFSCKICNKKFKKSYNLKTHELAHTEVKSYSCDMCERKYARLLTLKQHIKSHNMKEKTLRKSRDRNILKIKTSNTFSCKTCNMEFKRSFNLRRHEETHIGAKPYSCGICKRKFTRLLDLMRHKKRRAYCNNDVKELSHLKFSEKIHTEEKIYSSICNVENKLPQSKKHIQTKLPAYFKEIRNKEPKELPHIEKHGQNNRVENPHSEEISKIKTELSNLELALTGQKPYSYQLYNNKLNELPHLETQEKKTAEEKPQTEEISKKNEEFPKLELNLTDQEPYSIEVCTKKYDESRENILVEGKQRSKVKSKIKDPQTEDLSIVYSCETCQKEFTQMHTLQEHVLTHIGDEPYECNICKKKFALLDSLQKHEFTHKAEKTYECSVCNKRYAGARSLRKHKLTHPETEIHACSICKKKFALLDSLQKHEFTHNAENTYDCGVCNKKFARARSLRRHTLVHATEKKHACSICKKTFTRLDHLKRHIRLIHTPENLYLCKVCGIEFEESISLRSHEETHGRQKQYSCGICKRKFTSLRKTEKHKQTHEMFTRIDMLKSHKSRSHNRENSYLCKFWGIEFEESISLRAHEETHSGKEHYSCGICKMKFTELRAAEKHKKTHETDTREETYASKINNKNILKLNTLNRHAPASEKSFDGVCKEELTKIDSLNTYRAIHTNEKNEEFSQSSTLKTDEDLSCVICKKVFTRLDILEKHKLIHTGQESYSDVCGKSYEDLLRTHEKTHTEKQHDCDICNKEYSGRNELLKHKLEHMQDMTIEQDHGDIEKPYTCEVCGLLFNDVTSLRTHERTHAGWVTESDCEL